MTAQPQSLVRQTIPATPVIIVTEPVNPPHPAGAALEPPQSGEKTDNTEVVQKEDFEMNQKIHLDSFKGQREDATK